MEAKEFRNLLNDLTLEAYENGLTASEICDALMAEHEEMKEFKDAGG